MNYANDDLVGKFFLDETDCLDILQVIAVDSLVPTDVIVKPVNHDRC